MTKGKTVLVTGSNGFIGKNLIEGLRRNKNIRIRIFDINDDFGTLESHLGEADFVYHFAGVNRPQKPEEFEIGNARLTATLTDTLEKLGRKTPVLFTSSIQAGLDNPYGKSKKAAEDVLIEYNKRTGARIYIYRLPGVFGKWSRPNYNTVVATFCHNIARGLAITISDPDKEIELVYIDDVVEHFLDHLNDHTDGEKLFFEVGNTFRVTLGELSEKLYKLKDMRMTLMVPDLSDYFMKCMHATYLSFLDKNNFSYPVDLKSDDRGSLFELIKSDQFGQIFVSITRKGIVRGNHYHNLKVEKFCVIKGRAAVRFRSILDKEVLEYHVSDEKIEVVDIPPGYTHHIENLSDSEMIVLFWANQIFNPANPDTYYSEV